MTRWHFGVAVLALGLGTGAVAQHGAEQRDMALVGYSDLQARSVYQPTIHRQGDRYIAYIGHHGGVMPNPLTGQAEPNGTSILDVTNPKSPRYLVHIPGEKGAGEQGGAQMARVCNGSTLPRADRSKVYLLRSVRSFGPRGVGRHDPGEASQDQHGGERTAQYPQELLGMRHRDCVSRVGRPGMAHPAHDQDLRPRQPGRAGVHPRLWRRGAAARFDRHGAHRTARADLAGAEGEPRLLRAWHRHRTASSRSSIARSS